MPIFEYKCDKCEHKSEFLEKSDSKKKHVCEKCGSLNMRKIFSGFSVGKSSHGSDSCSTGMCPSGVCGL